MAIDEDDIIFVDQWREVPCEYKGFDFIYSYNLFQVIEVSNGRIQSKIDYFSPANYGYPGKTKTFFKNINDKENTELLYTRSEEHTSELQSRPHLVCRLLLEKKKKKKKKNTKKKKTKINKQVKQKTKIKSTIQKILNRIKSKNKHINIIQQNEKIILDGE